MTKRNNLIITFMLIVVFMFSGVTQSRASEIKKDIKVYVNGNEVNFNDDMGYPEVKNSRTMIPLRVVSEKIGFKVNWNSKERKVTVSNNNDKVELKVGQSTALVNGKKTNIDVRDNGEVADTKSYIKSARTFVPIRFVSEALGSKVEYKKDKTTHYIYITTGNKPVKKDNYYTGGLLDRSKVVGASYIQEKLITDKTPVGEGWIEPEFIYILDVKTGTPIRINVSNDTKLKGMTFDSRIIGKYSHYNSGTLTDPYDGVVLEDDRTEKDLEPGYITMYALNIPYAFKSTDANGKALNDDTVKGNKIDIEIIAKYKGMEKRYVIPVKL